MEKALSIFTLIAVFLGFSNAGAATSGAELRVCGACEVKTLKEAIARAPSGSTILLDSGVYSESNLVIDKPLRLVPASSTAKPVIDAGGKSNGLLVQSDHVEISGLTIRNSGFSDTDERAGIKVVKSASCKIQGNQLENNGFGIYLGESKDCTLSGNKIHGTHKSESQSGNGIHIWNSENITIENNESSGNRDGIYFEFVKHSSIRKNRSFSNLRYGLHFMFSHYNQYRENQFRNNDCGVAVMYSKHIEMIRNRFEGSHGPASYGILLKDISDSSIAANVFVNNTVGVFLEGTTRTVFEGNLFENNGWGLRILGDTDSNKIVRNDFIDNTFDVRANAGSNQNEYTENFWSHYKGLDLDKDGFGDDPYRPVQLSSMLMEQYDISVLLIHSTFFSILDQVESALPVLTPEAFKDKRPRMTRVTAL